MPRQSTIVRIAIPVQIIKISQLESIRTRPAKIDRIDKPVLSGSCRFLVSPLGGNLCYTEITAGGRHTAIPKAK